MEVFAGGGQIGSSLYFSLRTPWPMVRLTITESGLMLNSFWWNASLEKDSVTAIINVQTFLTSGIRIVHQQAGTPRVLFFRPFPTRWDKTIETLRRYGYPVLQEHEVPEMALGTERDRMMDGLMLGLMLIMAIPLLIFFVLSI